MSKDCFHLSNPGKLKALLLAGLLSACGAETPESAAASVAGGPTNQPDQANLENLEESLQELEESLQAACEMFPSMPGCSGEREPRPGFAKFTVGGADAVHWIGQDGCRQIDLRTGNQSGNGLPQVTGEVSSSCDSTETQFAFVHQRHSNQLSNDAWTSAFQPLNVGAAQRLLESCKPGTSPEPSAVVGSWWKANNTYAENLLLDYIAPTSYATRLLPFDSDDFERLEDDVIDGVQVAQFRNERATVWMSLEERDRPLRVVDNDGDNDIVFTDWGQTFSAEIPADMRELSEVCEL